MHVRLRGACACVIGVPVAVVVPTQELEILEVGWSTTGPVHDVMAFTGVWRSVAAGGLAVPVAYDERFPDCGGWCGWCVRRRGLGSSGGDDPADGAVAGQSLEVAARRARCGGAPYVLG